MARYKVGIKKSAQKELSSLPKKDILKIESAINLISENPKRTGAKKIRGK